VRPITPSATAHPSLRTLPASCWTQRLPRAPLDAAAEPLIEPPIRALFFAHCGMCIVCRAQTAGRGPLPLCILVYCRDASLSKASQAKPGQASNSDNLSLGARTVTRGDGRASSSDDAPSPGRESTRTGSDEPFVQVRNVTGELAPRQSEPLAKQPGLPGPAMRDTTPAYKPSAHSHIHAPLARKRKQRKVNGNQVNLKPNSEEPDPGTGSGTSIGSGCGTADAEHSSYRSSSTMNDRFASSLALPGDKTGTPRAAEPSAVKLCQEQACVCRRGVASRWLPGKTAGPPRYCIKCRKQAKAISAVPPPSRAALARKCACGRSQPSFGLPGPTGKVPRWCALCPERPEDAVDVVSKRCVCGRSKPSLGLYGEERRAARWCAQCPTKPPNAVDIVNKRCECRASLPSLGLPGESRRLARWCSQCPSKPPEAVNIINKKCECKRSRPRFGLPGDASKDARWCASCPERPGEAVDIVKKRKRPATNSVGPGFDGFR